jgi:hypothetical protein
LKGRHSPQPLTGTLIFACIQRTGIAAVAFEWRQCVDGGSAFLDFRQKAATHERSDIHSNHGQVLHSRKRMVSHGQVLAMGAQVLRLPRLRGACAYHRVGIQVVIRIATIVLRVYVRRA